MRLSPGLGTPRFLRRLALGGAAGEGGLPSSEPASHRPAIWSRLRLDHSAAEGRAGLPPSPSEFPVVKKKKKKKPTLRRGSQPPGVRVGSLLPR